jgi:hypothetical protein
MDEGTKAPRTRRARIERTYHERKLFELMDLPPTHLTAEELERLDAYMAEQRQAIRATWTLEIEASRRGVDLRRVAKIFAHDGRWHNSSIVFEPQDIPELTKLDTDQGLT